LSAGRDDFGDHGLGLRSAIAVIEYDGGALRCQFPRYGGSDAARAAGDNSDFSLEHEPVS
jgi:hypothetical protein